MKLLFITDTHGDLKIINNLVESYRVNSEQVRVNIDIDKIKFDSKTATSCGLILNELLTNALKYGFGDNETGDIKVHLKREKNQWVMLKIRNSGKLLPEGFNLETFATTGLKIVIMLVEQLHGKFKVKAEPETEFSVRFRPGKV